MRIPATGQSRRATQPSTPPSTVRTTGPQGTPGGIKRKPGVNGRRMIIGQEIYLWILVFVELVFIGALRKYFRRFHGG